MIEAVGQPRNVVGYVELARGIFGFSSDEKLIAEAIRGTRRFNKRQGTEHPILTPEEILTGFDRDRQTRDRLNLLLQQPERASLLMDIMDQAVGTLADREQRALQLRFRLMQGGEDQNFELMSLTGVGMNVYDDHTVTRERARQILAKALRKLRHPRRSGQLRSVLDGLQI